MQQFVDDDVFAELRGLVQNFRAERYRATRRARGPFASHHLNPDLTGPDAKPLGPLRNVSLERARLLCLRYFRVHRERILISPSASSTIFFPCTTGNNTL